MTTTPAFVPYSLAIATAEEHRMLNMLFDAANRWYAQSDAGLDGSEIAVMFRVKVRQIQAVEAEKKRISQAAADKVLADLKSRPKPALVPAPKASEPKEPAVADEPKSDGAASPTG